MNLTEIAAADAPYLLSDSGESVTRYPKGVTSGETVTAIVELDPVTRDASKGEQWISRGILTVAEDQTLHADDRWSVHGVEWLTDRLGDPDGSGLRKVFIGRGQQRRTTHR